MTITLELTIEEVAFIIDTTVNGSATKLALFYAGKRVHETLEPKLRAAVNGYLMREAEARIKLRGQP